MKRKIILGLIIIITVVIWITVAVSGDILFFSLFFVGSIFPFIMAVLLYCKETTNKKNSYHQKRHGKRRRDIL